MSPDDGDALEHAHDVAADRVVDVALGNADAGAVEQLVGSQVAGERDRVVAADDARAAAVVLVEHFADDLLDEVLEGDDAGGAAVLVDDDRHLVAAGAQLGDEGVEVHGFGHAQGFGRERRRRDIRAAVARHADGRLEVDDADDVVHRVVVDREAAVAGAAGELDDVVGGVVDARARACWGAGS